MLKDVSILGFLYSTPKFRRPGVDNNENLVFFIFYDPIIFEFSCMLISDIIFNKIT